MIRNLEITIKVLAQVNDANNDFIIDKAYLEMPLDKIFLKDSNGEVPTKFIEYKALIKEVDNLY